MAETTGGSTWTKSRMTDGALEPFKAIRRADGDLIFGEYSWMAEADWTTPSNTEDGEPTVWQLVEMRPVLIEERIYLNGRHVKRCDDPNHQHEPFLDGCDRCEDTGWVEVKS